MRNRINKYLWKIREISQTHEPKPAAFGRAWRFRLHGVVYTDVLYVTAAGEAWPWIYVDGQHQAVLDHIDRLEANPKVAFSHYDSMACYKLIFDVQALTPRTTQHDASFPPQA